MQTNTVRIEKAHVLAFSYIFGSIRFD